MENQEQKALLNQRNVMEQQEHLINANFKKEARKQALQSAKDLNPVERHLGQLGQTATPSISKVLSDADKIYEWLIQDIKK